MPAPVGIWNGEAVTVDGEEEPSFAEEVMADADGDGVEDFEEKEIWDREVSESLEECEGEGVQAIQQAPEYMSRLPEFNPRALGLFMAAVAEREHRGRHGQHGSAEDLVQRARSSFAEPAHAFAALDAAAKHMRARGANGLADRLAQARDLLEAREGAAIRAGLNTSAAAFEFSAGDQKAASALRSLYRDTVFSAASPAGVYGSILKQFGVEGFTDRLRFLTRAVGNDLASAGPSIAPARLREVLDELSTLHVLSTVHDRCREMGRRLGKLHIGTPTPTAIMEHLLPVATDPAPNPARLVSMPLQLGIPPDRADAQIVFMREAREVLALMPVSVFRDGEARFAVLGGMQQALDTLAEREDAGA
ncbi:type III secretion system gatekeeper subunit SctW [Belnapia sp. T18]|uniref:Type III secretion system gatekeeper subunit SctW n=1 Tax=Belnapia arida TaxID=2804533 RepID=A0ABS1U5P2_9PROT|nr:type III secretion system gatekeeper subunit SctW [Belnapia arida]MBL6080027.1 type III secretion system gatekeeper subunit SctW [Belnapia arida]